MKDVMLSDERLAEKAKARLVYDSTINQHARRRPISCASPHFSTSQHIVASGERAKATYTHHLVGTVSGEVKAKNNDYVSEE